MSNELKAAEKALGKKSVLDVASQEQPKVRRKRVPKTEVVADVREKPKEGVRAAWGGFRKQTPHRVSAPGMVWICNCNKQHPYNTSTVMIICYKCKTVVEIEKTKIVKERPTLEVA